MYANVFLIFPKPPVSFNGNRPGGKTREKKKRMRFFQPADFIFREA